jgi:hypothetical protein
MRVIVLLKNAGKDWTISNVATEAFIDWLKKPENFSHLWIIDLLRRLFNQFNSSLQDQGTG